MASKTDIKREIKHIKHKLDAISGSKQQEALLIEKSYQNTQNTNANNMLEIVKYMMNENKKTTMVLKGISDTMTRIEEALVDKIDADTARQTNLNDEQRLHELPLSELDARIVQVLQIKNLACADDVRAEIGYKGRNAASARLNRLHKLGIIERHQLGHKVYYKYDAGKTTNTLIVSPHSKQRPQ